MAALWISGKIWKKTSFIYDFLKDYAKKVLKIYNSNK